MPDALAIYRTACAWEGVPFRHQGRTRLGCDCAGLVAGVMAECGVWRVLPPYGPNGQGVVIAEQIAALGLSPRLARKAATGDLVAWRARPDVVHLGILGPDRIVHASASAGRVVRTGLSQALRRALVAAWDLAGLDINTESAARV